MDPRELKALLKEAKDSLKAKDYLTATKNCKLILKKIPDHYQANLFLGTSMLEQGKWAQAIESYKKATQIDPLQVYAWQGIILTYERQGIKQHTDLLDAYKRVATHYETDDKAKYIESTKKLVNVLISQQDSKGALKVITRLAKSYGVDLEIAGMITTLLAATKYDTRTPEQNMLYMEALKTQVTVLPQPTEETCKKYFTQVNRSGNYDEVIRQALAMRDRWNFYSSPMEWLCRYYIEGKLDAVQQAEIGPFNSLTDKLFKLHPSSNFGHFARGKFLIDVGYEMNDGFAFIATGLESNFNLDALKILIRGRIDYGDFEGAVEDCTNGLRTIGKDSEVSKELRLFLAEAWIWLDFQKAEELLENIKSDLKDDHQWILLNVMLHAKKLDFDSLRKLLVVADEKNVQHWMTNFFKVMLNIDISNKTALKDAIDNCLLLALEGNHFNLSLEASIFLFNLKFYQESADLLFNLTKTEIGRRRPLPWKYLGQLYSFQEDFELAAKCYKKSYKLCSCADVGALLSDTYFLLGKEDLNLELLTKATKSFIKSKSKWAWLRLGILKLHKDEANDAVTALQAAIRADITDCHVWESLADAYFLRGSYGPALSSYNKAIELGADHLYPKLRIGVVYQCLGHHDESIQTLKSLLNEYPENFTSVLVELARTHSLIAQDLTGENYDIRAKAAMEDALAYAVLAVLHSQKRILLPWQIIGESALTLNNLPDDETVKVPTFLLGDDPNLWNAASVKSIDAFEYKTVSMEKLREIGIQALLECLRMIESSPELNGPSFSKSLHAYVYHQLALLYFNRARRFSTAGDHKLSLELYKKSITAAKKAVAANQTKYIYWNSLGVIAYFTGNDELSQHSFIKSLQIEASNVVAWCNLGMLYLKHDKPMLAHEVFTKAQSASPLHSFSWIGQGLVAESIQVNEAPDLFRHAAHLEPSPFGVSCYADWINRILLKEVTLTPMDYWHAIVRVDALTIVNDLITKVEARNRTPQLYNMKGISAGLNGFYKTALESFTTALELSKDSKFSITPEESQKILLNKIVILVKLQRYEEAVEAFSTIENLDRVGYAVGALTMSKLGYLEQSEKLYSQLFNSVSDGEDAEVDKINVTIALGLVKNIHTGPESACSLLLQDFMVKSPHGLLALSAIGIMNNDTEFLCNVMPHLEAFQQDEEVLPDIGLMKTCFHIMNGNSKKGVNELLKLVHTNPTNARLWSILSQIVFSYDFDSIHSSTFRQITMTALKLTSLKSKGITDSIYSKSSAMISLCFLMKGDWKTAIITALSGIKKYPNERENWVVLACAFWYQFTETRNIDIYNKVVALLEKELSLNRIHRRAQEWASAFLELVNKYRPS